MTMTSRERLLRTLNRQPVDRVPISTYELVGYAYEAFHNQAPSYKRLMDKICADTDCIYMWGWSPWTQDPELWEHRDETLADGSIVTYVRLRTPKGDLTAKARCIPNVHTQWCTEHLLKTVEDIDRYLSVLPRMYRYNENNVKAAKESYARAEERLGDKGIIMNDGGDPAGAIGGLFEFGQLTVHCFQNKERILELIDALTEPMLEKYRMDAELGFGPMMRVYGPEYFTPPYLPPEYFRDLVMPGLSAIGRILAEGNIFMRVHSHGRCREVLPMIIEAGAKGLDPAEPPPDGNIPLGEVKQLYGDDLVLFGNTELKLLELGEPEQVRETVRQQMADAKEGGGYVMMTTASPINEPLSEKTERNYFEWIDAGLEYGAY